MVTKLPETKSELIWAGLGIHQMKTAIIEKKRGKGRSREIKAVGYESCRLTCYLSSEFMTDPLLGAVHSTGNFFVHSKEC